MSREGSLTAGAGIFSKGSGNAESKSSKEPLVYDPSAMVSLTDGYGASRVYKVTEVSTGRSYVLKQSTLEKNINAVLVSQFLKPLLSEEPVAIAGKTLTYHVPEVVLTRNHRGELVQQQEFLEGLETRLDDYVLRGIASFDNLQQMAKFGVIYQFLMLGDNMMYNHRFIKASDSYNIFDFDAAFFLGASCRTSEDSPFADRVEQVGHMYCDHFFALLAVRFGVDRYHNVFSKLSVVRLLDGESWGDFFTAIQQGLQLIKDNMSAAFITERWGGSLPDEAEEHLGRVRALMLSRLATIDCHLHYMGQLLSGERTLCDLDLSALIKASFDTLPSKHEVHGYLEILKTTMAADVIALAKEVNKPLEDESEVVRSLA
ncbi:MAG: hypothetical protein P1U63_10805 [Coxiellaceae bacterium]|nr:hypothetical protein [Coxiellaceae bacterium]